MAVDERDNASSPKIDAAALFRKLGLKPADPGPILEGWREANAAWRQERRERIALYEQRVQERLRRFNRPTTDSALRRRLRMRQRRAVWCVELRRHFPTLSEAARFVERQPSNISQSLARGVRCGAYHWEEYDPAKHKESHAESELSA